MIDRTGLVSAKQSDHWPVGQLRSVAGGGGTRHIHQMGQVETSTPKSLLEIATAVSDATGAEVMTTKAPCLPHLSGRVKEAPSQSMAETDTCQLVSTKR